jgi:hypothetical protein
MDRLIRITQQAEKPGRLQLAIVEWQRQLVAKREALKAEPLTHGSRWPGPTVTA